MAYSLMVEFLETAPAGQLRPLLAQESPLADFFWIEADGVSSFHAVGVSVPAAAATTENWVRLGRVLAGLIAAGGVRVVDMYSGETVTLQTLDQLGRKMLGG